MGGLVKRMPYTALFFLIGAVSISGLPPFNGFVSELMIFTALLQSYALTDPFMKVLMLSSLAILALTSALASACFVKAFGISFLAVPRSEKAKNAKEVGKFMLLGPAILALLCMSLGIFSYQIFAGTGYVLPIPDLLLIGSFLAAAYTLAWLVLKNV
jgi:hydrogenase-4 component B